jgi:hypothetical protein
MTFVKIGVSTKRMSHYTPLAHRRQSGLLGCCVCGLDSMTSTAAHG